MTSESPFISKLIRKHDQPLLEYSTPNGTIPNRLLSPISEHSAEILPLSLPINNTSRRSPSIVLPNDNSTIDELIQTLLQRFHQYTTNFHHIQTYLNILDQHFKELSTILNYLRNDKNLSSTIETIETRLVQMRVKRNHIDHLLNQSSIKIPSFILQSNSPVDYNELLTSIRLSMNQKTTLIDHAQNEYRYRKYHLNEYSSELQQRHKLLNKLTTQIEQFLNQHIQQTNHIFIINEHNRQCIELTNLSNEYEQLKNENHLLTLKAKENIQKYPMLM